MPEKNDPTQQQPKQQPDFEEWLNNLKTFVNRAVDEAEDFGDYVHEKSEETLKTVTAIVKRDLNTLKNGAEELGSYAGLELDLDINLGKSLDEFAKNLGYDPSEYTEEAWAAKQELENTSTIAKNTHRR